MSALDRAFIKAYAKDLPAAASGEAGPPLAVERTPTATTSVRTRRSAAPSTVASAIEQIYHEGSLYRIETPVPATPHRASVPAPHFRLPPRTSPKRNVRRSILRLVGQEQQALTPMPVEPPPARAGSRVPRNFTVLRSLGEIPAAPLAPATPSTPVAYTDAPQKRTSPVVTPATRARLPQGADAPRSPVEARSPAESPRSPAHELPPEIIEQPHEPLPVKPAAPIQPATPMPAISPAKKAAPLNLAEELGPRIDVQGHWDHALQAAASGALVCLRAGQLHHAGPAPLVELKLDALPEIHPTSVPGPGLVPAKEEVDEEEKSRPVFRIDAEHRAPRPHVKFAAQPADRNAVPPAEEPVVQATLAPPVEVTIEPTPFVQPADEPLTFADLDPDSADAAIAAAAGLEQQLPAAEQDAPATPVRPCIPVWEVDRFQWPVICERLCSDRDGYLAHAGTKLLAAVRDGLRTLAITGSRRGEGRTTLALCLARAAAEAGIQVAIVDADFDRPQLAVRVGVEAAHGWRDAALGQIPLSEAAVRSIADNITILPLGEAVAGDELSLADPRTTATLRAIAATFELVILDLGPLEGSPRTAQPADRMTAPPLFPAGEACPLDAAIVVRDLRYASSLESLAIGEWLYAAGIDAVGIAENFVVEEEVPETSV